MRVRAEFSALLVLVCGASAACSSSENAGTPATEPDGAANTGGSGGGGGDCAAEVAPCLDAPDDGFQISIQGTTIGAGEDEQWCEIAIVPGTASDTYYVGSIEAAMAPFSHHLNVRAIIPGSDADRNSTVGQRVECANNGRTPFGSGFKQLVATGTPYESFEFPEGVGLMLQGGQKVLFNYHYLNTSLETVPARARVNFHLVDASEVEREIRRFGMYNLAITVPPMSKASYTMECAFRQDVDVFSISRHTHRLGTDFEVFRAGGTADGDHVFTSTDWEEGIVHTYDAPVRFAAGEGYRFRCDFDNPTQNTLLFGELATDEMCILYGQWAVANPGDPAQTQDCVGVAADSTGMTTSAPCAQCPDADQ